MNRYLLFAFGLYMAFHAQAQSTFNTAHHHGIFVENKGQFHDQYGYFRADVLFGGQTNGLTHHILKDGVSYQQVRFLSDEVISHDNFPTQHLHKWESDEGDSRKAEIYRVDVKWVGANQDYSIERGKTSSHSANYYTVEDGKSPALGIRSFETVRLNNLWDGVDLLFYTRNGSLESDWILEKAEDYHQIKFIVNGADLSVDEAGYLVMKTPFGELREGGLKVFQNNKELKARWILSGNLVSFQIEGFEPKTPMRIDPPIRIWGTYFGGNEKEYALVTQVDDSGHVYMAGFTTSLNNIATVGAFQTEYQGNDDAFLSKYNGRGQLIWSTYLGGVLDDRIYCLRINKQAEVFIAGFSLSATGIASSGAYKETKDIGMDAFISKLDPNGHRIWGTYYGGEIQDYFNSCILDKDGNIYLAGGTTSSTGISLPNAYMPNKIGLRHGFIVKFSPNGMPMWATYFGGNYQDDINAIGLDANANIYGVGNTGSNTGFDTTGAHQKIYGGNGDAFIFKMDSSGNHIWTSYFGGSENDYGGSCDVDATGNMVITGWTRSPNQISTPNSFQPNPKSNWDAFVAKFNGQGAQLWGTYFGGNNSDYGNRCVLGNNGDIYLAGTTSSSTDIASPGAFLSDLGEVWSGYFAIFNSSGARLSSSYYCGDDGISSGVSCDVNSEGHFFMTGMVTSTSNIRTPGMFPLHYMGGEDAFLVKFQDCAAQPNITSISGEDKVFLNQSYTYTVSPEPNVDYYWHVENGNIVSGQGTNSVEIIWTVPNGNIAIEGSFVNGCNAFQSKSVSLSTGNEKYGNQSSKVLIYPNPNNGVMFLRADEEAFGKKYFVMDAWGRTVSEGIIQEEISKLEIDSFADGVYLIRIGEASTKVLKVSGK